MFMIATSNKDDILPLIIHEGSIDTQLLRNGIYARKKETLECNLVENFLLLRLFY